VTAEDGLNEKTKATKLMSVLKTVSVIAKTLKPSASETAASMGKRKSWSLDIIASPLLTFEDF
jgi:hypothetical protein